MDGRPIVEKGDFVKLVDGMCKRTPDFSNGRLGQGPVLAAPPEKTKLRFAGWDDGVRNGTHLLLRVPSMNT